ncbi:MAG TPA: TatD family hydrolase [Planctomycetota bacterium]|nr:TatD family hydrolase [Planctomycetota bacterium]HPY74238.1 TatD family hydrolase [Planctomycetota bacterium]HQB00066.1 TatD family hydrolase [Planctomycetota bacterium]
MQELIDIGVNLKSPDFRNDLDDIIQRALSKNVRILIATGTNLRSSEQSYQMTQKYKNVVYSTAGVHPHDARNCDGSTLSKLKALLSHKEVVAVGECGLDFNRNFSPQDVQKKWFALQVELACQIQKPLFLHDREASDAFISILKEHANLPPAVVHCFTGTYNELKQYLDQGYYIGITGWVCDERRGIPLQKIIHYIPLDRLMLETDAPFLIPRNIFPRPKTNRNEPAFLPYVLKKVAQCYNKSADEIAQKTTENARRFFQLP